MHRKILFLVVLTASSGTLAKGINNFNQAKAAAALLRVGQGETAGPRELGVQREGPRVARRLARCLAENHAQHCRA